MVLKSVIALCGSGDSGKTTTLNIFAELLEKKDEFQLQKPISDEVKNNKKKDCNYVFYDSKHNIKVVITTGGDTENDINCNNAFLKENVEDTEEVIWVCATKARSSGSVDQLDYYISEHKSIGYWIDKSCLWKGPKTQPYDAKFMEITNKSSAQLLADILEECEK